MNKRNKGIIILMVVLLTASAFLSGCGNSKAVAKVNGEEISQEELDNYVEFTKKQAEASGYIAPEMWEQTMENSNKTYEDQIIETSLQTLINQEVLLQKADELDVKVDDDKVEEGLDKYKETEEDAEIFENYLENMGISEEYFKKLYRNELIITAFIEETIEISDEEAQVEYDKNKEYYDRVEASHILFVSKEDDENIKKEAEGFKEKIDAGEDFDKLAEEYSNKNKETEDEEDSIVSQGLGYFSKGEMVPEFSEAAFNLKAGEISDVVKTSYGYHVIKVTGTKVDFESNKEEIILGMQQQKFNEDAAKFIDEADVEILLEFEEESTEDAEGTEEENTEDTEGSEEENTEDTTEEENTEE